MYLSSIYLQPIHLFHSLCNLRHNTHLWKQKVILIIKPINKSYYLKASYIELGKALKSGSYTGPLYGIAEYSVLETDLTSIQGLIYKEDFEPKL